MGTSDFSRDEIARRGMEIYERQLRHRLEPDHGGQYIVIDVETGDYEIDKDHLVASDRAAQKNPLATLYAIRVGQPTVGRIGMRGGVVEP